MDMTKLSSSDRMVAGGALGFLIAMFLPWFKFSFNGKTILAAPSVKGSHYAFSGTLALLLLLAAAAIVLLPAFGKSVNAPAIVVLTLTAIPALFVVLRFLSGEDHFSRSFGLFLAVLSALVAAFGALTRFKASGGSVADLRDPNKLKDQMASGFSTLAKDIKDGIDDSKK